MSSNSGWPFEGKQVHGMPLPEYLAWASGKGPCCKKLLLPPIQRGFVWKPKQIVDLWDSLLRGMPIGSLILSKLSKGNLANKLTNSKGKLTEKVEGEAMGLLDGQQRTLAMLIGYPGTESSDHCLWIDLAEKGHAGSPFALRLTTTAQPFGFERTAHVRLSRDERRKARRQYDGDDTKNENKDKPDYKLFSLYPQPRPWRANSTPEQFVKVKELWEKFRASNGGESAFLSLLKDHGADEIFSKQLYEAFKRMESLEVPLILIPEHIGNPTEQELPKDATDPLVLLFERIGRNGASLSAEDLLFSMIKQQWPEAQQLVNDIHGEISVRAFMSTTDYVMTAFRLAAGEKKIADNPRPNPRDFHVHLGTLLGKEGEPDKPPLRRYLGEDNDLTKAFKSLFEVLAYKKPEQDIGLPLSMTPHLSRGLVQVLLRWIMRNPDKAVINANRQKIISFSLFWYLNVLSEDKASSKAFEEINSSELGTFPATSLYEKLIDAPEDQFGLALPLMHYEKLESILVVPSELLLTHDSIFKPGDKSTSRERELYKRFCWWRKPVLLWLQRAYVADEFDKPSSADFAGLTDEDTVPYDYDHLCPQNHWGTDWRDITRKDETKLVKAFKASRHLTGNCIGNLHVLESSLNRSFGDDPLSAKLEKGGEGKKWHPEDSLLYPLPELEKLWCDTSPLDNDGDGKIHKTWHEERIKTFQSAVFLRAQALYGQYYEACKHILPPL